jgi:hypothetical protein
MKQILTHLTSYLTLILGVCLTSANSHAETVFPPALAGSYEGLLKAPTDPTDPESVEPFGSIHFTVSSKGKATGKLLLLDRKTYPFTANLVPDVEGGSATAGSLILVKKKGTNATLLDLSLTVFSDSTFTASGAANLLTVAKGAFTLVAGTAVKVAAYSSKAPSPLAGVYTFSFSDPEPSGVNVPKGTGYATGSVSAKTGALRLKGKLGDGTGFTASMKPASDGSFRSCIFPYSVAGGYFATIFQITRRSDGKYHVADGESATVKWKKVANAKDRSFPAGFGPVDSFLTGVQWTVPAKGQNVATVLGLSPEKVFGLGFDNVIDSVTYAARLPLTLGINSDNTLRVSTGRAGSPSPQDPKAWARFFSGKINPKTGLLTVTLKVEDNIAVPPARPKIIKRSITFNGVVFQLPGDSQGPIASGLAAVPPLDSKTGSISYGEFGFAGPITIDQIYQRAHATAGNYLVNLRLQPNPSPLPSGLPDIRKPVPFTISSDLKSIKFAGRTLPLSGDSRPVSLSYTNAPASPFNNVTVIVYLNGSTGQVLSVGTQYFQTIVGRSGAVVKVRSHTSSPGDVTKL